MINVISFSGGKDSTAMLIEMLERGEEIHSVVAFDTGWEFPAMYEHWRLVEEKTGLTIVRLVPDKPFLYSLFERPVKARKGPMKGQIHRHGYGWPSAGRRWCTRLKMNALDQYIRSIPNAVSCIGLAFDEAHRLPDKPQALPTRYPLIEYGITEKRALEICNAHGFQWNGLYEHFDRVSCFCCPLKKIEDLRTLRKHYPELWKTMLSWEEGHDDENRGFRGYKTVRDMDERFAGEE